jgi:hypothetical protein
VLGTFPRRHHHHHGDSIVSDFRKLDVTVTLTGEQWFAVIAQCAGKPFSKEGLKILREAEKKLGTTVVKAAEACKRGVA